MQETVCPQKAIDFESGYGYLFLFIVLTKETAPLLPNPDKRDKCLHQIFFLLKNKKKISKALTGIWHDTA